MLGVLVGVPAHAARAPRQPTFTAVAQHQQTLLGIPTRTITVGSADIALSMREANGAPFVAARTISATGSSGWSVRGEARTDCANNLTRDNGVPFSRCVVRLNLERPGNWNVSASGTVRGVQFQIGYTRSTGYSYANYRLSYDIELADHGYTVFTPTGRVVPISANGVSSVSRFTALRESDPLVGQYTASATTKATVGTNGAIRVIADRSAMGYRKNQQVVRNIKYLRQDTRAKTYTYSGEVLAYCPSGFRWIPVNTYFTLHTGSSTKLAVYATKPTGSNSAPCVGFLDLYK
ncbi:hypothetical protein D7223_31435 [Micromonospora endolithica]|uniref:Uncharacterized protein n=1 Tax=Micromonospora endolithica TaxID=230091 RepID=A0A3A9YQM5_9ACTN|nr:hypothetical protein D7223_31435 [Micromonospora endolithica]